mgnify:CR=1 FL=1
MELDDQVRAAVLISAAAVAVWVVLTVKILMSFGAHAERRPYILSMPAVGLLASIGTLASALGLALQRHLITLPISAQTLTIIASMGRGALLMGGVIALVYYSPKNRS